MSGDGGLTGGVERDRRRVGAAVAVVDDVVVALTVTVKVVPAGTGPLTDLDDRQVVGR